jgi:rhodanese-related sulfurtransferase
VTTIDAATLREWLDQPNKVTVIDVRTPAEFETARINGSVNIPLNLIEKQTGRVAERLHRDVVLVCQSGTRATQGRQRLAGVGADRLHVLDGGVGAFEAAGGGLVRGRPRWALERQVRLAVGSLVLSSLVAGMRRPRARLLAGGVAAGLTISALTDTCAMGRVLGALPYNRRPRDRSPDDVLGQLPAKDGA